MVQVTTDTNPWLLSAIYARNYFSLRKNFWNELIDLSNNTKGEWLIKGDFNEVLRGSEKLGGRNINSFRASCSKSV